MMELHEEKKLGNMLSMSWTNLEIKGSDHDATKSWPRMYNRCFNWFCNLGNLFMLVNLTPISVYFNAQVSPQRDKPLHLSNGVNHFFQHVQWSHMKIIGLYFEIIKDRQLYIFIRPLYTLIIPDNDAPLISFYLNDCDILIFSTFLAFRVLSLMNNYHVVLHFLQTLEHFPIFLQLKFSTMLCCFLYM